MGARILSEQVRFQMESFGIGQDEFARIVAAESRTVMRWLADTHYPQHAARNRLDQLDILAARLIETFGTAEGGAQWLRSPAGYFGGLRPLDALLSGRVDLVHAAMEALDSGVFV